MFGLMNGVEWATRKITGKTIGSVATKVGAEAIDAQVGKLPAQQIFKMAEDSMNFSNTRAAKSLYKDAIRSSKTVAEAEDILASLQKDTGKYVFYQHENVTPSLAEKTIRQGVKNIREQGEGLRLAHDVVDVQGRFYGSNHRFVARRLNKDMGNALLKDIELSTTPEQANRLATWASEHNAPNVAEKGFKKEQLLKR